MGNTPSLENQKTHHLLDSDANSNSLSPQGSVQHPLLSPSGPNVKTAPTSSSTRIMAQHNTLNSDYSEQPLTQHSQNSVSTQDVMMSGTGESKVNLTSAPSTMNIDGEGIQHEETTLQHPEPPRRRSTLILTDDPDYEKLKLTKANNSESPSQEATADSSSSEKIDTTTPAADSSVPVEIKWSQGGENVFITGSFTGWRKMIKLVKENDHKFSIKLRLPVGTHRFRFIVDNELRFSDYLPTATDQMGNFVNYIEIQSPESSQMISEEPQQQQQEQPLTSKDSNLGLTNDDDDMGNGYSRFHEVQPLTPQLNYVRDIPAIFTDPSVMEQYYLTLDNNESSNQSWLTPPQLPPHLESVILNNYSNADKTNSSGALPIPNHVVLNHLATTSIKHNTLAVASVVRYKRKYATQVLYAPLQ